MPVRRGVQGIDEYREYVTDGWGNIIARIPWDAPSFEDAFEQESKEQDPGNVSPNDDVPMSNPKRDRSPPNSGGGPASKKSNSDANAETPSQPNLRGSTNISPGDSRETHLINPNSRERNARNPGRNLPFDSPPMDPQPNTASVQPMAARSMTMAVSEGSKGKRRRAVMPLYTQPEWKFFEERKMVRLPLKINFSVNRLDKNSPVRFTFQLNEYWNAFRNQSFTKQTFGTQAVGTQETTNPFVGGVPSNLNTRSKGVSRDMAYDQAILSNGQIITKPVGLNYFEARRFLRTTPCETPDTAGTHTGEGKFGTATGDIQPDYRNFYERLYQNRHVHGCAWKMTITNGSDTNYSKAVCFHKTETVSQNNDSANQNWEGDRSLQDVICWPHKNTVNIQGYETIISGLYRSDQAHHDIIDDDEIKEWYPTSTFDAAGVPTILTYNPAYEEKETFLFYADGASSFATCFNVLLEIDWLVEYRDLRRLWRNPIRSEANTDNPIIARYHDMYPAFVTPAVGTAWPQTGTNLQPDMVARLRAYFNPVNAENSH